MTKWTQWDGKGYPTQKDDPSIYYAIGNVDVEDDEVLRDLATIMRVDGLVPSLRDGLKLLESAIVLHGQVVELDDETYPSFDDTNCIEGFTSDATWVEIDEYAG